MDIKKYDNFNIWISKRGYPCIWIDGKEIKLHIYVWEKANGNKPKGYDIHHKDLDKRNYKLSNLELLNPSEHRRIHFGWIREKGKWIKKPCNKCKKVLDLSDFYFIKTRNIESNFCKKCHNKIVSERNKNPERIAKLRIYKREYYRKKYGKRK